MDVEGLDTTQTTASSTSTNGRNEFVAGKIHEMRDFWFSLKLSALIRETLLHGFLPHFIREPCLGYSEKNRLSAVRNASFVSKQICALLKTGAISEKPTNQAVRVNPLSVAEGKKLRLILDLSDLNKYLEKYHVKYEDLS